MVSVEALVVAAIGLPPIGALLVIVVSILTVSAVWKWDRRLRRFADDEIGILVSLSAVGSLSGREEVDGVLRGLADLLQDQAASPDIALSGAKVVVRQLASHQRVDSEAAAAAATKRAHALFVVWATGTAGSVQGRASVDFPQVHFMVRHRTLAPEEQKDFKSQLQSVHEATGPYRVHLDNDNIDLAIVSANLGLVARYQIGLALAASGIRSPSMELLESTLPSGDIAAPSYAPQARRVAAFLRAAAWTGREVTKPGDSEERILLAREDAEIATRLDPKLIQAHAIVASCAYIQGDYQVADAANRRMRNVLPRELSGLYHVNRAAFALGKRRFDAATQEYRKAHKRGLSDEVVRSSIEWLYAASEHLDQAFLFGVAVMNDMFFDETLAAEQYENCLEMLHADSRSFRHVQNRLRELERVSAT